MQVRVRPTSRCEAELCADNRQYGCVALAHSYHSSAKINNNVQIDNIRISYILFNIQRTSCKQQQRQQQATTNDNNNNHNKSDVLQ